MKIQVMTCSYDAYDNGEVLRAYKIDSNQAKKDLDLMIQQGHGNYKLVEIDLNDEKSGIKDLAISVLKEVLELLLNEDSESVEIIKKIAFIHSLIKAL